MSTQTTVRGMLNVVEDASSIIEAARDDNTASAAAAEQEEKSGDGGFRTEGAEALQEAADGSSVGQDDMEHGDAANTTTEEDSDEERSAVLRDTQEPASVVRLGMYQHHGSKDSVGTASETDAASDHDTSSETHTAKTEGSVTKPGKVTEDRIHVLSEEFSSSGSADVSPR